MKLLEFLNTTKIDKEDFSIIIECLSFVEEYTKLRLSESKTALKAFEEPNRLLNPYLFSVKDSVTGQEVDNPEEIIKLNIEALEKGLFEYSKLKNKIKPVEDLWE